MDFFVNCLDCGNRFAFDIKAYACPSCGSNWRVAQYDYDELAKTLPAILQSRPFNIWRYKELLPVRNPNLDLSLGEGGTPLFRALNLGMMLGCPNIFIKDERQGPTTSFKDRQAAVTIAALKEAGITEMVVASTGNVAISYSAYAARAGIKLWAFLTSLVPIAKMHEVALYGAQVIKVTGSYDQTKIVAAEFSKQRNLFLDQGAKTIPSVEAMKTIAFEIAEQLTTQQRLLPSGKLQVPDWYLQAVSGGIGPLGVVKGFEELLKMGMIDRLPKVGVLQAEGCAPMVHAWKQGLSTAEPIHSPRTRITTLATGNPGRTYTLLNDHAIKNGGTFESISDEEAYRAMHFLAKMEGVSVEPAAAVAFAGLVKLIRSGVIKPTESVVVNCSGHTAPIEEEILGENWSRSFVVPPRFKEDVPEEGLLAALNKITIDRFPRIAIVDDNADVRRLIRRILQSQGNYTIFEVDNGREALQVAQNELPDLIILDLMMPEMDGFAVLDALQLNPDTARISVIVVTAKDLTKEEKDRLHGRIQSLMQKGSFMNNELIDEVKALLR